MRRSSSSSHIPLPRSKSFVRNSNNCGGNSAIKPRSSSTDRLPPLKRSNSSLSLSKRTVPMTPNMSNMRPSYLGSSKKSSVGKGITNMTPTSLRKKSPMSKIKIERNVNDKKWVSEQYTKVRFYLQNHPEIESVPDLKPPTLNTFVHIVDLLFREIDPRIKITMANYKEDVFSLLKSFCFPGTLSNSMMKTVNTMHSWPYVISIFSWLIDLVEFLNDIKLEIHPKWENNFKHHLNECIREFLAKRYMVFNGNPGYTEEDADAEFTQKFENIMGIDVEKNERLRAEVEDLTNHKEIQASQLTKLQNQHSVTQKELALMEREINAFYNNDPMMEKELDDELNNLKKIQENHSQRLLLTKENCEKCKILIEKQPFTYEEKMKVENHISELKHTVELKKKKIEARREIKDKFDHELVEKKKKVEKEVYRLNSALMQLTTMDSRLKVLYLRDANFVDRDFKDEMKNMLDSKNKFEMEIDEKLLNMKSSIVQLEKEEIELNNSIQAYNQTIEKGKSHNQQLEERIQMYNNKIEKTFHEAEGQKQELLLKIDTLNKEKYDINGSLDILEELIKKKSHMETNLSDLREKCRDFMVKLNDMSVETVKEMDKILLGVTSKIKQIEGTIEKQQGNVIKDLYKLDEVRKK